MQLNYIQMDAKQEKHIITRLWIGENKIKFQILYGTVSLLIIIVNIWEKHFLMVV